MRLHALRQIPEHLTDESGHILEVGDEIMYLTGSGSDIERCFGIILSIDWVKRADWTGVYKLKMHVEKTSRLPYYTNTTARSKVFLTYPTMFKVGAPVLHPRDMS